MRPLLNHSIPLTAVIHIKNIEVRENSILTLKKIQFSDIVILVLISGGQQ
jgi:hypothetical protein